MVMKVGRLHTRYTDSYLSIFTYSCSSVQPSEVGI